MAEYIDRAYLMGKITSSEIQSELKRMDGGEAYNRVLDIVNSAPSVDAVPVVHAHIVVNWLGDCHCSNCGESADCTKRYCASCGARLDEPEMREE